MLYRLIGESCIHGRIIGSDSTPFSHRDEYFLRAKRISFFSSGVYAMANDSLRLSITFNRRRAAVAASYKFFGAGRRSQQLVLSARARQRFKER